MPVNVAPNRLLDLLQRIRERTQALLLLTATPMQVHPVEVWDLLSVLGLPPEWNEDAFLTFCEVVDHPSPSHEDMEFLAGMFRATEQRFGFVTDSEVEAPAQRADCKPKRICLRSVIQPLSRGDRWTRPTRALALRVMRPIADRATNFPAHP